jgi:predicted N-acyltransferase
LALFDDEKSIAMAPGFLKSHSYGEYVFDWSWADAWHRSGLDYYPKLVTAIPFTPATGPRIWTEANTSDALPSFINAVTDWCESEKISSWHILFPEEETSSALSELGLVQRMTTQFHWFNRGYTHFDDFLAEFNSRKRKALKKERAAITAQNLWLSTKTGAEISEADWNFFYYCYQTTYLKRSGHEGYLTGEFFTGVCPSLGEDTVMVIAHEGESPVAAALYFVDGQTLYGRYWGCLKEFDFLHFETCYYRGIEYCIEKGLSRFDPGAQGEHKIQRGFEPTLTYSNHWISEPRLKDAVADFCRRDCDHVRRYRDEAATLLPFKQQQDA